ncbi:alpha/beta fold hydrolase [Parvularcula sp. ZS-1/3]|uniref:Alpha/beta fold hydrolase n=1 Tax=Parvularcula mediterranea TaxID=2732508 RepID=A0A7Y3W4K4_9PROT|nr:prolyl oligopeptidase family serine peptidase [Parvularcula mediterranea]NNU15624.1 alpha/beta fold hydrolase [Parvularcula mediterranea]
MRFILAALTAAIFWVGSALAEYPGGLADYYEGALTIDGTPVAVSVSFSEADDGALTAKTVIAEWITYDLDPDPVRLTKTGVVIEGFYGGDAVLQRDERFGQLVGTIENETRDIRLHLKPLPAPPPPAFTEEAVTFTSTDGVDLKGILTVPKFGKRHPAIILFHGRGCGRRSLGEARFYARRGMAALTFDKRGSGESGGSCQDATHAQTVADAAAALSFLASDRRIDRRRIGYRGISAGAWTSQALAERAAEKRALPDAAFVITWIGPSTSIRQQQLSSAETYGRLAGLGDEEIALAQEAVRLLTDPEVPDGEAEERLLAIRARAEEDGWLSVMFAPDDLPDGPGKLGASFLKKFRYDPEGAFGALGETPYLGVFGETDQIVPLEENLEALKAAFEGSDALTIVTIPGLGHQIEHGDLEAALPDGTSFLKIDTVEPGYLIATQAFLRRHGFMPL